MESSDLVSQPSRERFAELERMWSVLRTQIEILENQDVPAFNKLLQDGGVSGVIIQTKKPVIVM